MSGKGPASGFDFQSRVNAFVAVRILARLPLRWTQLVTSDVPTAIRAEGGGSGDDARVELADSTIVYECQAKRSLSADARLDAAVDLFAGMLGRPDERGILVVDPRSSGTIKVELHDGLSLWRQGVRNAARPATARVIDRLRGHGAESVADRLYVVALDVEHDASSHAQNALGTLERLLADDAQADSAWAVLVADGLRLCREGGRRTYDSLVALLGQANIQLSGAESTAQTLTQMRSMLEQIAASSMVVSPAAQPPSELDRFTVQVDTAQQLIDQGRHQAALDILRSIGESAMTAAVATRVRLHNLTGVALYHLGAHVDAQAEMLSALALSPDDKTALTNLAHVEMFLGNTGEAITYAKRAIVVDPRAAGPWVVYVQMDPTVDVPAEFASTPGILTARAMLALHEARYDDALEFLRAAVAAAFSAEPALLLAQTLYARAFELDDLPRYRPDLDEALALLDRVILELGEKQEPSLLERAYLTRGQIYRLVGNRSGAAADFSTALARTPRSISAAHLTALSYLDDDAPENALFTIERVPEYATSAILQLTRARALVALGRRADARVALEAALSANRVAAPKTAIDPTTGSTLGSTTKPTAAPMTEVTAEATLTLAIAETALDADAVDLAESALVEANPEPWLRELFRARIAARRGDDGMARTGFEQAIDGVPLRDAAMVRAEYAVYLRQHGDATRAVTMFEAAGGAANPRFRALYGRALYEAKELVKAAALLDVVKADGGELPKWALHLGGNIALASDDVPALIAYLEEFHQRAPDENEISVRLANAYVRARREPDALAVLNELARRDDVAPRQLLHMAELYIRAGQPGHALPLAYKALRAEPDAEDIQLAYLSIFHRREDEEQRLEAEEVAADTFVELKTDAGQVLTYFIVGDQSPRRDAGEVSPDDPIARTLAGKRVGDGIVLRPGALSQTNATISTIKTHFVHAFQDILLRFPERHPESVAIQSFNVPEEPTLEDFGFITESLRSKAEHTDALFRKYVEAGGLPLGVLAYAVRGTLPDAYMMVAARRNSVFFVEFGDAHQEAAAAARFEGPVSGA